MAELRFDPLAHRWVVTGKRPATPDALDSGALCPFCPGNEQSTPKAIRELRDSSGNWAVRVFHDRAPVFRIEGSPDARAEGMFDRMNTVGAHEVVVESPQHGVTLAQLPAEQIVKILEVCCERIFDLKRDRRFRYVSLFKDQSPASPTFEGHGHSQILATPVLAQSLEVKLHWGRSHYQGKERCLYCDIIEQEIRQGKRVVDQDGDFVALCPFASHTPYELWLLPLQHFSAFEKDLSDPCRAARLAFFLKVCLQRIEKLTDSLHLVVQTEPNVNAFKPSADLWRTSGEDFHWHIEIAPEVEGQRRYLGTEGFYFNPIPAEEAALVLRALEPGPPASPAGS